MPLKCTSAIPLLLFLSLYIGNIFSHLAGYMFVGFLGVCRVYILVGDGFAASSIPQVQITVAVRMVVCVMVALNALAMIVIVYF